MSVPFYVYDLLAKPQSYRWDASSPLGSPVTVTYAFPTAPGPYAAATGVPGYTSFSEAEQIAAKQALSYISSFTNITFVQATSTTADINFGNADWSGSGNSANTDFFTQI
jgi:hypothetical protein